MLYASFLGMTTSHRHGSPVGIYSLYSYTAIQLYSYTGAPQGRPQAGRSPLRVAESGNLSRKIEVSSGKVSLER